MLAKVSVDCEVLACTVEERNLYSVATGWQDGRRIWSVTYDGEEIPNEIAAEGDLPFAFEGIRRDYTAKSKAPGRATAPSTRSPLTTGRRPPTGAWGRQRALRPAAARRGHTTHAHGWGGRQDHRPRRATGIVNLTAKICGY